MITIHCWLYTKTVFCVLFEIISLEEGLWYRKPTCIIRVSMALNDKYITGGWIRIVIRSFRNNGRCRDKWQNYIQRPASRPLGEEASMNVDESLSIRELGNGAVHPCPLGSYNECLPSLITAKKTQTLITPIHLLQNLISSLHYK